MVERPLSMREVPGSIPGISKFFFFLLILFNFEQQKSGMLAALMISMHVTTRFETNLTKYLVASKIGQFVRENEESVIQ